VTTTRMSKLDPNDPRDAALLKQLAACVLDERTARTRKGDPGDRGSTSEDSGLSYGGRPRNPKRRKRPAQTRFDSYHTWKG
jgi:hypothetical protein